MDTDLVRLKQNIARIRRDIRLTSRELLDLIDRDQDCSGAALVMMHLQNDLRPYLEKQERLLCKA